MIPSGDVTQFTDGILQYVNPSALWGSLVPLIGIIGGVFLFAFVYGRIRKVTKKGSQGKFGM